jgi:phosphoglycolate phosphatase
MGSDRVVAHLAGDAVAHGVGDEVRRRHHEYFERLIPEITATDGASELLSLLRERSLNVVVASSGEPALVSRLLEIVDGGPALVHHIVWGSPTLQSKPAPDLFHAATDAVGGREAVVIGDSIWDTQAATAAGLPCLAVRTGGFCDTDLLENGAVAVYESPRELLDAPELKV